MTNADSPHLPDTRRLVRPTVTPDAITPAPARTLEPPTVRTVGRFRVERELGRGGMGVVLLASDPTLGRPVALKMLREDDPATVARFRLEAAALAGLAHPHAVRVYEFGDHAGRPYLAMEYVAGRTLAAALLDGPLDPSRAAGLVAAVAGAVQAAHDAGVIHRDLKPANVLLDSADQPKLTDFGLALRTDRASGLTDTDAVIGTPFYMAPEQAAGRAADARTDVYGLGSTLYQCLTGRPPFVGPPAAVLRQLASDDPLRPRRLNPAVPRDLETVCLKCLEKDPARRYATAAELAADLDRCLAGKPIVARPIGRIGRAVRWCRRHRAVAALTAVAAGSLVGGSATARVAAYRATVAQQRAEDQAAEAETERGRARAGEQLAAEKAAEAQAINDFLLYDLLALAPGGAQVNTKFAPNPNLTMREALDRAAKQAGERFHDQPAVEERVRATLGKAYHGVSAYDASVEQLKLAFDSRRKRLGPDHPDTLDLASDLAWSYRETGNPIEAVKLLEDAVPRFRKVRGEGHADTLKALSGLASAYKTMGQYDKALAVHEEALRLRRQHLGPEHAGTVASMNNLADQYRLAGRAKEALPLAEESVRLVRLSDGPAAVSTIFATTTLAMVYGDVGQPDRMLELCREVQARCRETFGETHAQTLSAVNTLAMGYHKTGRMADCVTTLEESLRLHRKHMDPAQPRAVTAAANLAWAYLEVGRAADAVPLLEAVVPARRKMWGEGHPEVLRSTANLATAYGQTNRWADALPVLADECRVRAAKKDPKLPLARADLGHCLLRLGRFAEAEPHLLAGHAYHTAAGEKSNGERNTVRVRLAELYTRWGRPADAAGWREIAPSPRPEAQKSVR